MHGSRKMNQTKDWRRAIQGSEVERIVRVSTGLYRTIHLFFFFSSRRRHTRLQGDWSSDVCSSDLVRIQAERMSELLGQTIVTENIGAAAGTVGSLRVAKAAPDGYTFLIGNSGTHAYSQWLYKKQPYNAATDFDPVGMMTESPRALIARKNLPANNLKEFIAYLKANEKTAQFGSAGVGAGTHIPCVLLNMAIGVDITHIPYRGDAPVVQDIIGGRIDYMCA